MKIRKKYVPENCDVLFEEEPQQCYDDREVRPGFMFADADLFGVPVRIVVSQKTEERGVVEVSTRDKSIKTEFAVGEAAERTVGLVRKLLAEYEV